MTYHFAVDVGASKTRCLIATNNLDVLATVSRPTPQGPTKQAFTDSLQSTIESIFAATDVAPEQINSVGVASFGPLSIEEGLITATPNLDENLHDIPLRATIADCFLDTPPITILNDATAGVTAEYQLGGDEENVVYVTFSSGVGAGAVIDGHLLSGRNGNAAEIGHFTLDSDSNRECGCGGRGHWEAFVSGENIPDYAIELRNAEDLQSDLPTTRVDLEAEDIFDHYGEDPLATVVVDRIGHWNTIGMANLTQAFAPDRIAIGGAVALNNDALILDPIRDQIDEYPMIAEPAIHLTEFGEEVVIKGALLRAIQLV